MKQGTKRKSVPTLEEAKSRTMASATALLENQHAIVLATCNQHLSMDFELAVRVMTMLQNGELQTKSKSAKGEEPPWLMVVESASAWGLPRQAFEAGFRSSNGFCSTRFTNVFVDFTNGFLRFHECGFPILRMGRWFYESARLVWCHTGEAVLVTKKPLLYDLGNLTSVQFWETLPPSLPGGDL